MVNLPSDAIQEAANHVIELPRLADPGEATEDSRLKPAPPKDPHLVEPPHQRLHATCDHQIWRKVRPCVYLPAAAKLRTIRGADVSHCMCGG